jgi:hypothetical protein
VLRAVVCSEVHTPYNFRDDRSDDRVNAGAHDVRRAVLFRLALGYVSNVPFRTAFRWVHLLASAFRGDDDQHVKGV